MKHFINIFILAVAIAGCNDNTTSAGKESTTIVKEEPANEQISISNEPGINDVDVDTLGMAEFMAMKAAAGARRRESNGIESNGVSEINDINIDTVGFGEFKRLRAETVRQAYDDSIKRAEIIAERKRYNTSRNTTANTTRRSSKQSKPADDAVSTDQEDVATKTTEPVKEKRGWSKKAKGAVIGAATGAAAGAIINKKNRGVGGIVGGVVGGATGYGIGRSKDKKDEKKELAKDSSEQQQ